MKRILNSLFSLLLILALVFSTLVFTVSAEAPTSYSKSSNSGQRHEICTSLSGTGASSYYTGSYTYEKLSAMSSSALKSALRTLMTSTHTTITSYSDCKNYSDQTDCENNDGRVVLLYSSYSATMSQFVSGSTGWNREHVWPQSLGGFGTTRAGADLHHIRPDDVTTNGTRGNLKYGNVTGGSVCTGSSLIGSLTGGTYNSSYFEPNDNVKGDVARICLYVYVRWGGEYSSCDSITTVFQSVDTLLEWCELDPVDTWEMGRNEVVENIQGNRNVFIDYPELAWVLFGKEIPEGMTTPSGSAGESTVTPSTCYHLSTYTVNAYDATCGTDGYTGDTYCTACGNKVSAGSVISATGDHIWSEWEADGVELRRFCEVCYEEQTEEIEKTDDPTQCTHQYTVTRDKVDATCSAVGYTGDTYCASCSVKLSTGAVTEATGLHKYGDAVTVTPPTEQAPGLAERICSECGDILSEQIPRLETRDEALADIIAGYTTDTDMRVVICIFFGFSDYLAVEKITD